MDLNFEEDVRIDELALDVEWVQQPSLMAKYCSYAAETKKMMDLAKERVDVVAATLDKDIRSNPEKYDLGKVTESAIQNIILLQPEYREANDAYIEARYENEMAQAAVRALDQKKSALKNLVKLLGLSYFASPNAPHDLHEAIENRRKGEQKIVDAKVKIRRRSES